MFTNLMAKFISWVQALLQPSLLNLKFLVLKLVKAFVFASFAYYLATLATPLSFGYLKAVVLAGVAGVLHALSHVNNPEAKKGS